MDNKLKDFLYILDSRVFYEQNPYAQQPDQTGQIQPIYQGGAQMIPGAPGAISPYQEEPIDPEYLGKIYILKKIYVRLISLDKLLEKIPNEELIQIKKDIIEAIEIFHSIVMNFDLFKEKLDAIIILYQELISKTLEQLENNYEEFK